MQRKCCPLAAFSHRVEGYITPYGVDIAAGVCTLTLGRVRSVAFSRRLMTVS
jgi:hypothetical protein